MHYHSITFTSSSSSLPQALPWEEGERIVPGRLVGIDPDWRGCFKGFSRHSDIFIMTGISIFFLSKIYYLFSHHGWGVWGGGVRDRVFVLVLGHRGLSKGTFVRECLSVYFVLGARVKDSFSIVSRIKDRFHIVLEGSVKDPYHFVVPRH